MDVRAPAQPEGRPEPDHGRAEDRRDAGSTHRDRRARCAEFGIPRRRHRLICRHHQQHGGDEGRRRLRGGRADQGHRGSRVPGALDGWRAVHPGKLQTERLADAGAQPALLAHAGWNGEGDPAASQGCGQPATTAADGRSRYQHANRPRHRPDDSWRTTRGRDSAVLQFCLYTVPPRRPRPVGRQVQQGRARGAWLCPRLQGHGGCHGRRQGTAPGLSGTARLPGHRRHRGSASGYRARQADSGQGWAR